MDLVIYPSSKIDVVYNIKYYEVLQMNMLHQDLFNKSVRIPIKRRSKHYLYTPNSREVVTVNKLIGISSPSVNLPICIQAILPTLNQCFTKNKILIDNFNTE